MVQPEDLLKFGLIPELVGRLPVIATMEELDEDDLIRILKEPKNALTKQYEKLFEFDGVQLRFTEGALTAIARKALDQKIRGPRLALGDGKGDARRHVRPAVQGKCSGMRDQRAGHNPRRLSRYSVPELPSEDELKSA
jgi:hypothetical protein